MSDTTYTDVLDKAKKYAADAETDAQTVGERRRELEQIADELQELDVDNDSLGELLELASLHARAEEIHKEIQDRAGAVPTGLQNRHGGVNEAAADQPVKMAHRGFYGQQ